MPASIMPAVVMVVMVVVKALPVFAAIGAKVLSLPLAVIGIIPAL